MPRRNSRDRAASVRELHIYNRQTDREPIFLDDEDRRTFLWMIARYLDRVVHFDSRGRPYKNLSRSVRLLAFALMTNHFHLVLRQLLPRGAEDLMQRTMTSYVRYFNRKYGFDGAMCEDRFRAAVKIDRRSQLNAIAYVHDNHGLDCRCEFCSHRFYGAPADDVPAWIDAGTAVDKFGGAGQYIAYRELRHGLSAIAD